MERHKHTVIVEQLLHEVHVGEQHPPAAVPPQPETIEGLSAKEESEEDLQVVVAAVHTSLKCLILTYPGMSATCSL